MPFFAEFFGENILKIITSVLDPLSLGLTWLMPIVLVFPSGKLTTIVFDFVQFDSWGQFNKNDFVNSHMYIALIAFK
jgi:hypothetical protein